MFSQYNLEQQAWARQQDLNRQAVRSTTSHAAASTARVGALAASSKSRLVFALAAIAPALAIVLLIAAR
jgi:hypothetical protein